MNQSRLVIAGVAACLAIIVAVFVVYHSIAGSTLTVKPLPKSEMHANIDRAIKQIELMPSIQMKQMAAVKLEPAMKIAGDSAQRDHLNQVLKATPLEPASAIPTSITNPTKP